mmetsp:Transcript_44186/g.72145  ORF Transcript_44186/g.72145 Transcript_44186/m.72145 type:complete len:92 (+) Transcript_44186:259-534(+)
MKNRLMTTEEAKSKSPPLKFDFVGSKNIRRQKPEAAIGCVERFSCTFSRGLSMYYVFGHDESLAAVHSSKTHHKGKAPAGSRHGEWGLVGV